MEHTLALIEKAHEGDKAARDTLAEENMGLVGSMVRRFAKRGVEMEDLCQIGSIGLLKAIDKFDPSFEVCFSTYAVPMIAGEIRRFLRSEGMVKVSRPIRELAWKAYAVRERLERENGRDPTLAEIAGELDVTVEEIVEAMESGAEVESLQKTISDGPHSGKRERAGKAAEPDFLGRAVGTTAREGAAAHLHALFSGHDAGADRRKTGDFAGAGVADGKEDSAADADGKGLTKIQIRRKGAFPGKGREKRLKPGRIKEEKKGEAGKGGRKFENIHWNIGGRCATMSEIRRKAGGRTWII